MTGFVAAVLCAGYGTRLRPLTEERPKPAVPVFNRPLAFFALRHLAEAGARAVALNTHHLSEVLERSIEPLRHELAPLRINHERELLGTGGGIRALWPCLEPDVVDEVIVANGDVLFRPNVARALSVHRQTGAIATMVVRRAPRDKRGAAVGIELRAGWSRGSGQVVRLRDKSTGDASSEQASAMFTGVHVFSARAYSALPMHGDIITESYHRWLAAGELVSAVFDDGDFFELGTLRDYLEVQVGLLRQGRSWAGAAPVVSGDATIESTVSRCVVGRGAVVRAEIEDSIVWEGSVVESPTRRAVVTPTRRVDM